MRFFEQRIRFYPALSPAKVKKGPVSPLVPPSRREFFLPSSSFRQLFIQNEDAVAVPGFQE